MRNTIQCDAIRQMQQWMSHDAGDATLDQVVAHIDNCEACRKDPAVINSFQQIIVSPEDTVAVDEILASQESDERPIVSTVEILLGSLAQHAADSGRQLGRDHGPYSLYAAQESVSSIVRRFARRRKPSTIEFRRSDYSIAFDGIQVLSRAALALEIARFAELWTNDEQSPHPDTLQFVDWIFLTLESQPFLLRDFSTFESPRGFWLRALLPHEREDDVYLRWSKIAHTTQMAIVVDSNQDGIFLVEDHWKKLDVSDGYQNDVRFLLTTLHEREANTIEKSMKGSAAIESVLVRRLDVQGFQIDDTRDIRIETQNGIINARYLADLKAKP